MVFEKKWDDIGESGGVHLDPKPDHFSLDQSSHSQNSMDVKEVSGAKQLICEQKIYMRAHEYSH